MANYVNQDRFIDWYRSVSKRELKNEQELLDEAVALFAGTGKGEYVIPAEKSLTGKRECYSYKVENIGCCGASTIYVYF